METHIRQQLIEQYIQAYNAMDVAGMLAILHRDITFQNISNGEVNLSTQGIDAFKAQAEQAVQLFRERRQTITGMDIKDNEAQVQISYRGIIAQDLPNGWKAGDKLEMAGQSVFRFQDGKISSITDIS
jgi:ketosteroid isomerase-like protein